MLKNRKATARWFHAFADETRLAIIERLSEGEQCVCFHLKTLKDAGIVTDRPEGRWVYYSLSPKILGEVEEYIKSVKESHRDRKVTNCCE